MFSSVKCEECVYQVSFVLYSNNTKPSVKHLPMYTNVLECKSLFIDDISLLTKEFCCYDDYPECAFIMPNRVALPTIIRVPGFGILEEVRGKNFWFMFGEGGGLDMPMRVTYYTKHKWISQDAGSLKELNRQLKRSRKS